MYLIVVPLAWVLGATGMATGMQPVTRRQWAFVAAWPFYVVYTALSFLYHFAVNFLRGF